MTEQNVKVVYRKPKSKTSVKGFGHWAESKKIELLTLWMATGNLMQAAADCGVPHETAKSWRYSDWWKEKQKAIENEDYDKFDKKLTKAIDKALDSLVDRIENGETIYDPKTGGTIRMPAKLRDLNAAFNTVLDKRQVLRKQPTKIVEQQTTASQLTELAAQFAQFVNKSSKQEKIKDVTQEDYIEATEQEDGTYTVE